MTNRAVIGEEHGELTLVRPVDKRIDRRVSALWKCSCGVSVIRPIGRVRGGYIRSCGHLARDAKPGLTHGMRGTKEYGAWTGMKERCMNPRSKDYPRYGGRGITVYEGWVDSFENFFDHIGPSPTPAHQVDRINNEKGYMPGNVRWATPRRQARNRRGTYTWSIKGWNFDSMTDAARHFNVSTQTIHRWVHGFHDARRGTYTPKREDCHATPRY